MTDSKIPGASRGLLVAGCCACCVALARLDGCCFFVDFALPTLEAFAGGDAAFDGDRDGSRGPFSLRRFEGGCAGGGGVSLLIGLPTTLSFASGASNAARLVPSFTGTCMPRPASAETFRSTWTDGGDFADNVPGRSRLGRMGSGCGVRASLSEK